MPAKDSIRITLTSQIAECPNGHNVGDTWTAGRLTPGGLCLGAMSSLMPAITALRFGGNFPWMSEAGVGFFCCPDHNVQNVFKLERLPETAEDA
jgi:uncharacterized repeat protein (TIGR04076 family)